MRDLLILTIHLLVTVAKFLRPGGVRAVVAESLALKHQLLISNRFRRRAPNLTTLDRIVLALTTLFVSPQRTPCSTLRRKSLSPIARERKGVVCIHGLSLFSPFCGGASWL